MNTKTLNLIPFDRRHARHNNPNPQAHLRNRTLYLNKAARDWLNNPSHIRYSFDEDAQLLLIEPTSPDNPHAYRLGQAASIKALLTYYRLEPRPGPYPTHTYNAHSLLVDLTPTSTPEITDDR